MGSASHRGPSFGAGFFWWINCLAAGYILGKKYGSPWAGLAIGGAAGIVPSLLAAAPVVGGPRGCMPFPVGVMFGIAMAIGGVVREGIAWGVAGISAFFVVVVGGAGLAALRTHRLENRYRKAVAEKDLATIVAKWPGPPDGREAAVACLAEDPAALELILMRRRLAKTPFEQGEMLALLAATRRPEARPVLVRALEDQEFNSMSALDGLVLLADPQDLPLIFRRLNPEDEIRVKAAIDLAMRHGRRDLVEQIDLKDDRDLIDYRSKALGR